ncbi:MAG TPA: AmmeMemoRadiSam system protein A [Casimicrobiaceae bacterium]|jgi:AmmeMemoRadiSam system protein A|nr:AmmeMemoRadiSam system protein A [Casimicrobiaceae bacterium]
MPDDHLGRRLLALARHAIAERLGLAPADPQLDDNALRRPGASFVTLLCGEALRGCIGSLLATRALAVDVRENALAAAFRDPRFAPLSLTEFATLSIEVSLLSRPQPALFATEADLLARLVPGVDGLALELGEHRATFLPQVWETLPDPRDFVAALKAKAGLPEGFWSSRLNVSLYRVTKWKERELLSDQTAS